MEPEDTRNVKDLIISLNFGSRPKYVFFWGHTSLKDGSVNKSCLSQWYGSQFTFDGNRFCTAEHYMMYRKAVLFNDIECSHKILDAKNPGAAKALGRAVKNFDQEIWNDNCFDIVVEANILREMESINSTNKAIGF